jgi:hypothetical protein
MWQLLPKAQLGLLVIVAMVLVLMAMALMAMALVPRGQDCDSCEQQRAKRWEGLILAMEAGTTLVMVMVLVRMTRLMPAMHPVEVSVQVPVVACPPHRQRSWRCWSQSPSIHPTIT